MNILFSFLFILLGTWGLYQVGEKQIKKTRLSRWSFLTIYPPITRLICLLLLSIAMFILIQKEGSSIGVVSFWIFATPLIFIFILYINELKPKQK